MQKTHSSQPTDFRIVQDFSAERSKSNLQLAFERNDAVHHQPKSMKRYLDRRISSQRANTTRTRPSGNLMLKFAFVVLLAVLFSPSQAAPAEQDLMICKEGSVWNPTLQSCEVETEPVLRVGSVDCLVETNATAQNDSNSCTCAAKFFWDYSAQNCVINCSQCTNCNGIRETGSSFICRCILMPYFQFSAVDVVCNLNCSVVPYTNNATAVSNSCVCVNNKFVYNRNLAVCQINCSGISKNAGSVAGTFGSCKCLTGFQWNGTTFNCDINCSSTVATYRTSNLTEDGTTCPCIPLFSWASKFCRINCSAISKALAVRVNNNTCNCINGWTWNLNYSCSLNNCSALTGGLSGPDADGNCTCKPGFVWNSTSKICLWSCVNVADSNIVNNTLYPKNGACYCAQNFDWNGTNTTCSINCSKIAFAINGSNANYTAEQRCDCLLGYIWNVTNLNCSLDCLIVNNSDKSPEVSGNCTCNAKFQWNPVNLTCDVNCSALNFTNSSTSINNGTSCVCNAPFSWDEANINCSVNCSLVNNSDNASAIEGSCVCVTPFTWNLTNATCDLDCTKVPNSNGTFIAPFNCSCIAGYTFNTTLLSCVIDCVPINNTDGTPQNNGTCVCKSGFYWDNTTKLCVINCTVIPYATGPNNSISCTCLTRLTWDPNTLKCILNCSSLPEAPTQVDNATCLCLYSPTYFWNNGTFTCDINCTSDPYSNGVPITTTSPESCACLTGFTWSETFRNCSVVCSQITHATGDGNGSACDCEAPYFWNPEKIACNANCSGVPLTTYQIQDDYPCNCVTATDVDAITYVVAQSACVLYCTKVTNYLAQVDTTTCSCQQNFSWDPYNYDCSSQAP